ncbi:cytochrome P450 [Xylariaceae sp. FL1019]|nr:cytochrome P450 [Xylariaceae sp. FL1019]
METTYETSSNVRSALLVLNFAVGVLVLWLGRFLYQGISIRFTFWRMKRKGLPVPEPHSFLLGHLPLMKSLRNGLPKDAHDSYSSRKLTVDWHRYFPNLTECPPVIYLDMWPLFSYPVVHAISPEACYQITQQKNRPRHPFFGWALKPITGGQDIITMDIPTHRMWRASLKPAFSLRNLNTIIPVLTEEVAIFTKLLCDAAGSDGGFGEVFPLYERTRNLTFDIILKASLDMPVHEQTQGPSPLLKAMKVLNKYVKAENMLSKLERAMPKFRRDLAVNSSEIDAILRPHIEKRDPARKSVVDFALAEIAAHKGVSGDPKDWAAQTDLVDTVISNMKLFIVAGHHTTAQVMCWVLYEVYSRPEVLKQVRAEVQEVLGPDVRGSIDEDPLLLSQLRYSAAVIKETLRFNPVASTHRQGSAGFNLFIDGQIYPTLNGLINTSPISCHMRSDLWPEVNEFIPERYLVDEDSPLRPAKNAWRPFELGSTRCIGEELAMIEMKLALAFTVGKLDMEFDFAGWYAKQNRDASPNTVDGQYMYRIGHGIGAVKESLPTRVRLRPDQRE